MRDAHSLDEGCQLGNDINGRADKLCAATAVVVQCLEFVAITEQSMTGEQRRG